MRLFGLFGTKKSEKKTSRRADSGFDDRYWEVVGSSTASGGVTVNLNTARQNSAVYACVKVYAETMASLPLLLYRRFGKNDRERANDNPLFWLLNHQPNEIQTRFEFIELLCNHLLLRGNFYGLISQRGDGTIAAIEPLDPDLMTVVRTADPEQLGPLLYVYRMPQKTVRLLANEVLHVRYHSDDGIVGKSVISWARETLGASVALDTQAAATFRNSARMSGILEHPQILSDEVAERIKQSWRKAYAGVANTGETVVLEEGMSYKPVSMTNADAQFIESRNFQLAEIARIFRVPPHMIQDLSRSTFSNIESQSINFVTNTIRPFASRIEMALSRDLLRQNNQKQDYFIEFLLDALMRGDAASRGEFYSKMFSIGAYSVNTILAKENENGIGAEGDKHFVPVNMQPIDKVGIQGEEKPSESKRDDDLKKALVQLRVDFVQYFGVMFERIVNKEQKAIAHNKPRRSGDDWTQWLQNFTLGHKDYVVDHIAAGVKLLEQQIRTLSDSYGVAANGLPSDYMQGVINAYVGKRFDYWYAERGEEITAEAEAEKLTDGVMEKCLNM